MSKFVIEKDVLLCRMEDLENIIQPNIDGKKLVPIGEVKKYICGFPSKPIVTCGDCQHCIKVCFDAEKRPKLTCIYGKPGNEVQPDWFCSQGIHKEVCHRIWEIEGGEQGADK